LYSGVEATQERRSAALAVREALCIATAPTVEQRAPVADAPAASAPPVRRAARAGPLGRTLHAISGLLHRLLLAGAWTLTAVSLMVIGVAAVVIFIMRSPEHAEERAALERALPPLSDAVTRGAVTAKSAVDDAVSDARERVSAAFPPPVPTGAPADTASAPRAPARDPWRGATPPELRKLRTRIDTGQRGNARTLGELRRYNREHPEDPRGHLLLARLFVNRGAWNEAAAQYRLAFARDASSRGDPRMLQDLLRAAGLDGSSERASELLRTIYGREALGAIVQARLQARSPDERARLDRLASAVSP
jgi:hypothetical protein